MVDINKTLDGTLDKAISASEKLKDIPKFMQSYILGIILKSKKLLKTIYNSLLPEKKLAALLLMQNLKLMDLMML